jgi:hypothetical protein
MWRDLTEEPAWKYEELPPLLLAVLTELDLFEVGDTELARPIGFGRAGPSSPFMRALCSWLWRYVCFCLWLSRLLPGLELRCLNASPK